MRNERLRALLLERGKSPDQLAEHVRVDAKTVERWITRGRLPYRRHRFEVASFLGVDESYIWPDALGKDEIAAVSESEIVAVWPHRSEVSRDTWGHLFSGAEREIGVLVYAGLFLSEDAGVQKILKDKASSGVRVRILLGDPDSQVVTDRRRTRASGMRWRPRSVTRWRCTGRCGRLKKWSSGSTGQCCTTRFTVLMTRCWLIPTCSA
jgi:transcriptional regulator with XRE-family HTH domain